MQLGMVGLGRMGANMVRRLMRGGQECVAFDLSSDSVKHSASTFSATRAGFSGLFVTSSPDVFLGVFWSMPAGSALWRRPATTENEYGYAALSRT